MNKNEFLRQLEQLLSGISEEERADAMAFYRSYFEDAGEENEAVIIAELESPQKVAESILKNMGIDGNGSSYNAFANRDEEYYRNVNETVNNLQKENKKAHTTAWVLGITVAVLTSPIWITILLVIAALLLVLVATVFAVAIAIAAVMIALVITGFVLLGVGIGRLSTGGAAVGLALVGSGLILLAFGVLAVVLTVWVFGVFVPWACRGIYRLCKKPFEKRKECRVA